MEHVHTQLFMLWQSKASRPIRYWAGLTINGRNSVVDFRLPVVLLRAWVSLVWSLDQASSIGLLFSGFVTGLSVAA